MRLIISGGGTGGHIFPAIAIANAVKLLAPNSKILFVGAENRMEMEKVPAAGYEIIGLPVSGFIRKLTLKNIKVVINLLKSIRKSKKIIKDFQPDVVVGVGGYASGPILRSAVKKKIKTLIQEQNSYAGVTNKILSKKVNKICVAYQNMEKFFPKEKIIYTGNPVRQNIVNDEVTKEEALNYFNFKKDKKTILSIGGSLGARTINESIIANLEKIANSDYQLIWQTGKTYFKSAKEKYDEKKPENIKIMDFISRMDLAYKAADIVISRAGAISISELCLVKKPVIFVPSPNVAEDHQTKNAMALTNQKAGFLVKDSEAKDKLIDITFNLLKENETLDSLSKNIEKFAVNNSAEKIAKEIIDMHT